MIKSPEHYKDTRLMDLLIDKQVPFAEGNVMKYVFRWREKDGLKDLYKARDYLLALIASSELEYSRNFTQELSDKMEQIRPEKGSN